MLARGAGAWVVPKSEVRLACKMESALVASSSSANCISRMQCPASEFASLRCSVIVNSIYVVHAIFVGSTRCILSRDRSANSSC